MIHPAFKWLGDAFELLGYLVGFGLGLLNVIAAAAFGVWLVYEVAAGTGDTWELLLAGYLIWWAGFIVWCVVGSRYGD